MKKTCIMLSMLLGACTYKISDWDILPIRNTFIERMQSHRIDFFDQGPKLLKTEDINEKNYIKGEVLTVYKGFVIVDDKTYRKEYYSTEKLRANRDGVLNSAGMPVKLKKNEEKSVVGVATVDGVEYFLVPSYLSGFVLLVNDDGTFYSKMGQIRNDKLVILDDDFYPYPESLRLEPVVSTRTVKGEPVKGFEIKYDGANEKEVSMTYYDFAEKNGDDGYFKTYKFKNEPSEVEVNGVKIKILFADDVKLEYMLQ